MKASRKDKPAWNGDIFRYADSILKQLMKDQNRIFEFSKFKFEKNARSRVSKVKKIDYKDITFSESDFSEISRSLYIDELNTLTTEAMLKVAQDAYQRAYDDFMKMIPENDKRRRKKPRKLKKSDIERWNMDYVSGLRTSYHDSLVMQSQYMAYRLSNAMNENIHEESQSGIKDRKPEMIRKAVDMGAIAVLLAYRQQKKKYANATDNAFANVVNMSRDEAFRDMGVEFVIRIAELDNRTCKDCEELDGEIYTIDEAPDVILHDFCRCYYLPWEFPVTDEMMAD